MDFGVIKDIGSAFLVGSAALLVAEAFLYFCTGWTITGFFRLPIGIDPPTTKEVGGVQLGAFVGIATIAGLLCQSPFQALVDNAEYPISAIPQAVSHACAANSKFTCLPSKPTKEALRLAVFYDISPPKKADTAIESPPTPLPKATSPSKETLLFEATPLLKELVKQRLPQRFCADLHVSADADQYVTNVQGEAKSDDKECLTRLYYTAKNWAYTQPQLFDDLQRYQSRIEFERSFALVAVSLLPWAPVVFFSALAYRVGGRAREAWFNRREKNGLWSFWLRCLLAALSFFIGAVSIWGIDGWLLGKTNDEIWTYKSFALVAAILALLSVALVKYRSNADIRYATDDGHWPRVHRSTLLMLSLCVLLVALHVVGYYAYAWDEKEYAKRAYGYFTTQDVVQRHGEITDGLRWYRGAAERRALYSEVYRSATTAIDTGSQGLTANSWGVILDVDETVLDNSYIREQMAMSGQFDPARWDDWARNGTPTVIPQAREFIDHVISMRGKVFLVTNRTIGECPATEQYLNAQKIRFERILCDTAEDKKEKGDKNERFSQITNGTDGYQAINVIAWIGDNIKDFPKLNQENSDTVLAEFGTKYFVLPNPMYGSWETQEP